RCLISSASRSQPAISALLMVSLFWITSATTTLIDSSGQAEVGQYFPDLGILRIKKLLRLPAVQKAVHPEIPVQIVMPFPAVGHCGKGPLPIRNLGRIQ